MAQVQWLPPDCAKEIYAFSTYETWNILLFFDQKIAACEYKLCLDGVPPLVARLETSCTTANTAIPPHPKKGSTPDEELAKVA